MTQKRNGAAAGAETWVDFAGRVGTAVVQAGRERGCSLALQTGHWSVALGLLDLPLIVEASLTRDAKRTVERGVLKVSLMLPGEKVRSKRVAREALIRTIEEACEKIKAGEAGNPQAVFEGVAEL